MVRVVTLLAMLLAVVATSTVASPAAADRRYLVRAGDTLTAIARRNRVSVDRIRRANRLRSDRIRPGMRLVIPGRRSRRDFGIHRVRAGESLVRIARRYDVSVSALQRANRRNVRGTLIRPGMRLRIPGRGMGRVRAAGARPAELTEEQVTAEARAGELGLGTARVAHRLLIEPPRPEWIAAAGEEPGDGTLLAPVEGGRFLRGWGSGAGGYHMALDIGAPRGTPVRASEAGLVVYAGNAVRGYGNTVIVVHPTGLLTWYAHNHQNVVVAGQRVARGEQIGTVGDTGYARGTHVHFMLVDGTEHCDALPLMRPGFRDRDGADVERRRARWLDERPAGVRCLPRAARPHPRHRRRARRRARRR